MSVVRKKVVNVGFKAPKAIDWDGMAKMIVTDEARKEFSSLRRAFEEVNSALQTKFSQVSDKSLCLPFCLDVMCVCISVFMCSMMQIYILLDSLAFFKPKQFELGLMISFYSLVINVL